MKKILILLFSVASIYSCKKFDLPLPNPQVTTGTLHYSDPAYDGQGLFYETDQAEILAINADAANMTSQGPKYIDFVDTHSRLVFTYNGKKGCLFSMISGVCTNPHREVIVNKLEKL